MSPLYLGPRAQARTAFAAFAPQRCEQDEIPYISIGLSAKVKAGYTQVALPLYRDGAGHCARNRAVVTDRRNQCPRASSSSQHLAFLPPSLHAHSNSKKNMSLLTLSRFRSSQCTPANTNKPTPGQAFGPAPNSPVPNGRPMLRGCVA